MLSVCCGEPARAGKGGGDGGGDDSVIAEKPEPTITTSYGIVLESELMYAPRVLSVPSAFKWTTCKVGIGPDVPGAYAWYIPMSSTPSPSTSPTRASFWPKP